MPPKNRSRSKANARRELAKEGHPSPSKKKRLNPTATTLNFIRRFVFKKRVAMFLVAVACFFLAKEADVVPTATTDVMPLGMVVEDPHRPGLLFNTSTIKAQHPVVMIPGFVSTALEVWKGDPCIKSNITSSFRQRMFSARIISKLLSDPECYLKHMTLNKTQPATDPEGISVRAAEGLDATDYLVPGFWVWAKVIINLADIGYTPKHMYMATYDWRLSPELMEERDGYFTELKDRVEYLYRIHKSTPVASISHSYGGIVFAKFLEWADARSPGWTNKYVHSFYNIGGPMLGMPKSLAALISGEFKDTALLPSAAKMLVDTQLTHTMRTDTFRSWPCLTSMLPRGPDAIWQDVLEFDDSSPLRSVDAFVGETPSVGSEEKQNPTGDNDIVEDTHDAKETFTMSATAANLWLASLSNESEHMYTVNEILNLETMPSSTKPSSSTGTLKKKEGKTKVDQLLPFPMAPKTTVYCVYGVDIPTENGYYYSNKHRSTLFSEDGIYTINGRVSSDNESEMEAENASPTTGSNPNNDDADFNDTGLTDNVRKGVKFTDGDGTIPLSSLGYLCHSKQAWGWKQRTNVKNIEHSNVNMGMLDPRGGIGTADHVDMMGNYKVITDLLNIVSGNGDLVEERVVSDIEDIVRVGDEELLR